MQDEGEERRREVTEHRGAGVSEASESWPQEGVQTPPLQVHPWGEDKHCPSCPRTHRSGTGRVTGHQAGLRHERDGSGANTQ